MRLRSSSRTSSAAAFCSPPRRSRPAFPNPWLFLATWAVGGALAFAGAMAYAELAALRPRAGGEYVYLRAAFGRVAAFLTGWTSFIAGFSGAIAANSVILAAYVGRFIPAANDGDTALRRPVSVRAAHVLPSGRDGALRDRPDDVDPRPRRRSRTLHHECACGSEGLRASHLHCSGVHDRSRIRERTSCRLRVRSLAARGFSR